MMQYVRVWEPFHVRLAMGGATRFNIINHARQYVYHHTHNVMIDTIHEGIMRRVKNNAR